MAPTSTSFRLSRSAKQRLAERAEAEGVTATALLERLIVEGVDTLDHPGVVYRGAAGDRRAGLAGGPDVWEVVARLRQLHGPEEQRIADLAEETDLHTAQIRSALEFAADHPEDITARIERNERAIRDSQDAARRRRTLLG